ncbi:MAG: hypothetical protein JAY66_20795 [Candidatus Thiodiazotropha taylori]|nr:hypothetical protein [Candidatus Thiodiazotropha taylori]
MAFPFIHDVGDSKECLLLLKIEMHVSGKILFLLIVVLPIFGLLTMSTNDSDTAPCGACGLEVTDIGILCDTCSQWYHPNCQQMGDETYEFHIMNPDFSWVCLTCGAPNHSVSVLDCNLDTLATSNSFSSLSDSASRLSGSSADHTTSKHTNLRHATLKVLNINARSIISQDKLDQFHAMLDQLRPDIVTCTESWLTSDIHNAEIIPDHLGYTMFRRDRGSRGGGVFILVRDQFIATRVHEWETKCEIVWIKLQLAGSVPLHIAAYYKPNESDPLSFEEFKKSVAMVNSHKGHIWILGDFNYPKFTWTDNTPTISPDCKYPSQYEDFVELLDDFSLSQMVTRPTRYENILDLFLIDNPTLVKSVEIKPGIADHDAVLSEVFIKPQINKLKPRLISMYSKADWEGLENHLLSFQESFLASCEGKSVNLLWEQFRDALQVGIEKYVPQRTVSTKPSLPWVTQEIKRLMRKRDSLYDKYKKHRRPTDRHAYVEARHTTKQKLKQAHNKYIEGILGLTDSDSRTDSSDQSTPDPCNNTYASKKLYSLLKNSKKDSKGTAPLQKDGKFYTETVDKANILNDQFQSVFTPKSPLKLSQLSNMAVQNYVDSGKIDPSQVPTECLSPTPQMSNISVSLNGILKLLKDLNPHKAAGPDQLKPLVLQKLRDVIAPVLQVIFQKSLDTGKVPKDWTSAFVCPLFKKGDTSLASNYRPISLTSILCKVLEHIVSTNVVSHMDKHNLLYDLQHGFRSKRSCETQLVTLLEDLMRNSTAGSQTDLVLLDFSKAFDKVSHQKLLLKLHKYGIRGPILTWIQAFLSNRTQTVVLENEHSNTIPVTSGVPQGSVLGPILFLIYINDLPDMTKSKVRLFADDTAIYLAVSSLRDAQILQQDLDHLHKWELEWDMEFNPGKCVVIHVTRAITPVPSQYFLHSQLLESVSSSKYLGVEISSNLSFNKHIQNITTSASRSLAFLRRNIRTQNPALREMAYKTLVRPLVEYSSPVWSPYTQTNIDKLEMVQRRAARWTLHNYSTYASVTDLLQSLGWRSLEQRRSDSRLCLFYKIVHGLVAVDLPPYVVHPMRILKNSHPMSFRQIQTTVDYYKYSFYPLAIVQWNRLPSSIALLPTFDSFKRAVCTFSHSMP